MNKAEYDKLRCVFKEKGVPINYLGLVIDTNYKVKEQLRQILGGEYVKIPIEMSEEELRNTFPETTYRLINIVYRGIATEAKGKEIAYLSFKENKLMFTNDKNEYKLSRYLHTNISLMRDFETKIVLGEMNADNIQTVFTKLFDNKIQRYLKITTNPADIMLINEEAVYSSCYDFKRGSNWNATIAYAIDPMTVASIVCTNADKKIGRAWTYIPNDKFIFIGRPYGTFNRPISSAILEVLSKKMNFKKSYTNPQTGELKRIDSQPNQPRSTHESIGHQVYWDGIFDYIKAEDKSPKNVPLIVSPAICLNCGKFHNNSSGGVCGDCISRKCQICGEYSFDTVGNYCRKCIKQLAKERAKRIKQYKEYTPQTIGAV